MAKNKNGKPNRDEELIKVNALIAHIENTNVAELGLEASLEEVRSLNDRLELIQVEALAIDAPSTFTEYGGLMRSIKKVEKRLEEERTEAKAPHLEASRKVDAMFKGFQTLAERIRKTVWNAMKAYEDEEERKRRAKEAALREKARKEQERLQRAAEKKAEKLEAKGDEEAAAEVLNNVPTVPTPTVEQTNVPKVSGVSSTRHYYVEMTDKDIETQEARLRECIVAWNKSHDEKNQLIAGEYWSIDHKALGAMARSLKGKLTQPNVKVVSERTPSVRA